VIKYIRNNKRLCHPNQNWTAWKSRSLIALKPKASTIC